MEYWVLALWVLVSVSGASIQIGLKHVMLRDAPYSANGQSIRHRCKHAEFTRATAMIFSEASSAA